MKKNIKEAIKEHLRANAFATDPNNPGFVDRFLEHTKAAEWGAEWRINSVWHDVKEKPNFKMLPILLKHKSGTIHFIDSTPADWRYLIKYYVRWAYIEDLLPNMEE